VGAIQKEKQAGNLKLWVSDFNSQMRCAEIDGKEVRGIGQVTGH